MADLSKETATVVFRAVAFVLFAGNFFVVCLISSSIGFFFFYYYYYFGGPACPVCWESSFRPAPATTFPDDEALIIRLSVPW